MSTVLSLAAETADVDCLHCGQPVPSGSVDGYCCRGCRAVASLLSSRGLGRYYQLRLGKGVPVTEPGLSRPDHKWLEGVVATLANEPGAKDLTLELQGMHCSACVWLVETLFERSGAGSIEINPALGRVSMRVDASFPLERFVGEVEDFGYRFGPAGAGDGELASDGLLVRAGVSLALAGNGMMLTGAIHLGLDSGAVHAVATHLSFVCACIAMAIGAPIFVRSAWAGMRRGALHLDLPIALGMGLAFAGSAWSYFARGGANYVDTLTTFVALMLLGRWLKTRVLERNQRELLRDPGFEGVLARRISGDRAGLVAASELRPGDTLLAAPGDLVPCTSRLIDDETAFSFDWIDGESRPRALKRDEQVPAGALVAGDSATRLEVLEPFASSLVFRLVSGQRHAADDDRTLAGIPRNVGAYYVSFVLAASAGVFALTLFRTGVLSTALELTTATLVVTCPCAFGIAVPLAYELVQGRLRRLGVFVRRPSLFDRALAVRDVVFDKTGTLTTGRLSVVDGDALASLGGGDVHALYDLASRSSHPKSRAVATFLEERGLAKFDPDAHVIELRGRGLERATGAGTYRLGSASFALEHGAPERAEDELVFARDGRALARIRLTEELRPETGREVARLRDLGLAVHIASGDAERRCAEIGAAVGLEPTSVRGDLRPDDKKALVEAIGPSRVMMIGDGLNDAEALATAACSGTPAIDRPFTATRCDFYFVTPGLEPVSQVLLASRSLARVVRSNLALALFYNGIAVGLCAAGIMRPWLAALFMPASSLLTVFFTVGSLRGGTRWTS